MAAEKVKDNLSIPSVEDGDEDNQIPAEDWAGFDDEMKEAFREAGYRPEGEEEAPDEAQREEEGTPDKPEEAENTEEKEPEKGEKAEKPAENKEKEPEKPKEAPKAETAPEKDKKPAAKEEKPAENKEKEPEKPKEAPKEEAAPEKDEKTAQKPVFPPIQVPDLSFPVIEAPADIDDKISDVTKELTNLAEDFDNGNITSAEYNTKMVELQDKRQDLRYQKQRAEDSRIQSEKWQKEMALRQQAAWVNNCNRFLGQHTEYDPSKDQMLYNLLNSTVAGLRAGKYKDDSTNPQILQEAHDEVQQFLHRTFGADAVAAGTMSAGAPEKAPEEKEKETPKGKEAKKPKEAKEEPKGKKESERPMAPNIGSMPASGAVDDGANPFAYLDRLAETSQEKYEQALAKLTPAQLEEYSIRGGQ